MRTVLIFTFTLIFSLASLSEVQAIEYQISENHTDLLEINKTINKRWKNFEKLQENADWISAQSNLKYFGPLYKKGWYGPRVQRFVLPDVSGDFIVMDTITLNAHYLEQLSILGANFLFRTIMPFIEGTPLEERTFSKITRVNEYEEALKLKHMEIKELPIDRESLNRLKDGEKFNTTLLSGFTSRFTLPLIDFLDIVIPDYTRLGPQAKLKITKSLDITIEKAQEDTAIITIKHLDEKTKGLGTGFNIFVDDVINLPFSIGINGSSGYAPIVFNLKKRRKEIKELIYRIDLSTLEGQQAYASFLKQDFTVMQDLENQEGKSVELYIQKDGKIKNEEFNWGLNLLLLKSGARYIREEGQYTTTFNNGDEYNYDIIELKKITDNKGFSGVEKRNFEVRAIVPTNEDATSSFTLELTYSYDDQYAFGSELIKELKFLTDRYLDNGVNIDFDKRKDYGKVQIYSTLMFSTNTLDKLMSTEDYDLWEAIALAYDFADTLIWIDQESRAKYKRKNTVYHHSNKSSHHMTPNNRKKERQLKKLKIGQEVFDILSALNSDMATKQKAKLLVENLRDSTIGPILQRTMVNLVGVNNLMGQGFIRGKLY